MRLLAFFVALRCYTPLRPGIGNQPDLGGYSGTPQYEVQEHSEIFLWGNCPPQFTFA